MIALSFEERANRLLAIRSLVDSQYRQCNTLSTLKEDLAVEEQTGAVILALLQPGLDIMSDMLTDLGTMLTSIGTVLKVPVKPGMPVGYTHALIEAISTVYNPNSGGDFGVIRTSQESLVAPFSGYMSSSTYIPLFKAGDRIKITNAEDAANNTSFILLYTPQPLSLTSVLTNGSFTGSATGWTLTGADVSYSANTVVSAGAGATGVFLEQGTGAMAQAWNSGSATQLYSSGSPYLLTFTYTITSGTLRVLNGSSTIFWELSGTAISGTGVVIIPSEGTATGLRFSGASFVGVIDTVSLIPFTGLVFTTSLGAANAADTTITLTLEER